jgi:cyclopropane fatty-acyl-phospholipid synthase-like methyltransferase
MKGEVEMYSADELIVRYWDQTIGTETKRTQQEDLFCLEKAKRFEGPVLNLACGTGRLSLFLANKGFEVISLDNSSGMLQSLKNKISKEAKAIQDRITIKESSMTEFKLMNEFNLILCINGFSHNLNVQDVENTLKSVAQHLSKQGRFIFNIGNKESENWLELTLSSKNEWIKGELYQINEEQIESIQLEHQFDFDAQKGFVFVKYRVTCYDIDNQITQQAIWVQPNFFLNKNQYFELFKKCGFEIDNIFSNLNGVPFTEDSPGFYFQLKLK